MIKTPSSLKWLINKKARLEGEIIQLESVLPQRIDYIARLFEETERRYLTLQAAQEKNLSLQTEHLPRLKRQLEAIKTTLGLHDVRVDPNLIQPIRSQSAKRILPYGSITREIYAYLRLANGPVTTKEISRYLWEKYRVHETNMSFRQLTRSVHNRLNTLCREKKVLRLHSKVTTNEGIWKMPS